MRPTFALIDIPIFFQIFTPIAPSANDSTEAGDRALGEIRVFKAAGIEGGCPGQSSAAVAMNLLGGASFSSRSNVSPPLAGQTTMSSPCQFDSLIAVRSAGASRWM